MENDDINVKDFLPRFLWVKVERVCSESLMVGRKCVAKVMWSSGRKGSTYTIKEMSGDFSRVGGYFKSFEAARIRAEKHFGLR